MRKTTRLKVTPSSGNVFRDLGFRMREMTVAELAPARVNDVEPT